MGKHAEFYWEEKEEAQRQKAEAKLIRDPKEREKKLREAEAYDRTIDEVYQ